MVLGECPHGSSGGSRPTKGQEHPRSSGEASPGGSNRMWGLRPWARSSWGGGRFSEADGAVGGQWPLPEASRANAGLWLCFQVQRRETWTGVTPRTYFTESQAGTSRRGGAASLLPLRTQEPWRALRSSPKGVGALPQAGLPWPWGRASLGPSLGAGAAKSLDVVSPLKTLVSGEVETPRWCIDSPENYRDG